jgi:hypothetical protein
MRNYEQRLNVLRVTLPPELKRDNDTLAPGECGSIQEAKTQIERPLTKIRI